MDKKEIKDIIKELRKRIDRSKYHNWPVQILDSCPTDIYMLETIMKAAIKYTTFI